MFCIIHKIPQKLLLGKNHYQISLKMHQPKETACNPYNKNVRLLSKSLILETSNFFEFKYCKYHRFSKISVMPLAC